MLTQQHRDALDMWRTAQPNLKPEAMVGRMQMKFNLKAGEAWILVARYRNERHTQETK
jgi:hypothetical protein